MTKVLHIWCMQMLQNITNDSFQSFEEELELAEMIRREEEFLRKLLPNEDEGVEVAEKPFQNFSFA